MTRTMQATVMAVAALLSFAWAGLAGAADAPTGAALYARECSKCHGRLTVTGAAGRPPTLVRVAARRGPDLAFAFPFGPALAGVIGRPAGSVAGYEYSKAFAKATQGLVWSAPLIDAFITDTQAFVRGTRMYYKQTDANVRARIVEYLSTARPE